MSDTPTPDYAVLETHDDIEIRDYGALVVAEAVTTGPRREAINAGFRILAGYIFGDNADSEKIAMTAPVTQRLENDEATPDSADDLSETEWRTRFYMPPDLAFSALPVPTDPRIELTTAEPTRLAAIRFSGFASQDQLTEKTAELVAFLDARGLAIAGGPIYAFYNSPFRLPFLRRNEVMLRLVNAPTE